MSGFVLRSLNVLSCRVFARKIQIIVLDYFYNLKSHKICYGTAKAIFYQIDSRTT